MWLVPCPVESNGLVRALRTECGHVVLMCDECATVWLTPDTVEVAPGLQQDAPEWLVAPGVAITPGTTRWATFDELPKEWQSYPWYSNV